jgi:RND family efflux transporter MFP subunit
MSVTQQSAALRISIERRFTGAMCLLTVMILGTVIGCHREVVPAVEPKPPKVTVSHPTFMRLTDEDSYSGWLRPSSEVEVRSRVRGHVQKVSFHDGQLVERNQVLFELDPRPFQAQIAQAEAQARAIDAQRVSLEKDVARYTELVKSKAVAQQTLDKAIADVGAAEAEIAAMQQEVKTRRLDLDYAQIKAPIAGRIGRAMLTEGNLVNAGGSDPLLATIVAVNPISIYFSVDERALQRFQKSQAKETGSNATTASASELRDRGMKIRFGLETDDGFPHTGILDFASNKIDAATGTIEVRAEVKNPTGEFVAGSRVRIRVPVGEPYEAILVPDVAVNTDQDRKYLLLVGEKNLVQRRDVQLGRLLDDGSRVVRSSEPTLTKENWVIVEGVQRARLNYPVDPVPEASPMQTAAN